MFKKCMMHDIRDWRIFSINLLTAEYWRVQTAAAEKTEETKNASALSTSEGETETIVAHQQAQPSTNYDDVYFDASFEPYRAISASIKMPRTKVNLLVRNCVSSLVAKCAKKTSRAPTKTDFDDLAKKLLQYYPSLPKNIRRKIVKRYMNANANAKEKKTLKQ